MICFNDHELFLVFGPVRLITQTLTSTAWSIAWLENKNRCSSCVSMTPFKTMAFKKKDLILQADSCESSVSLTAVAMSLFISNRSSDAVRFLAVINKDSEFTRVYNVLRLRSGSYYLSLKDPRLAFINFKKLSIAQCVQRAINQPPRNFRDNEEKDNQHELYFYSDKSLHIMDSLNSCLHSSFFLLRQSLRTVNLRLNPKSHNFGFMRFLEHGVKTIQFRFLVRLYSNLGRALKCERLLNKRNLHLLYLCVSCGLPINVTNKTTKYVQTLSSQFGKVGLPYSNKSCKGCTGEQFVACALFGPSPGTYNTWGYKTNYVRFCNQHRNCNTRFSSYIKTQTTATKCILQRTCLDLNLSKKCRGCCLWKLYRMRSTCGR